MTRQSFSVLRRETGGQNITFSVVASTHRVVATSLSVVASSHSVVASSHSVVATPLSVVASSNSDVVFSLSVYASTPSVYTPFSRIGATTVDSPLSVGR